jgi:putative ABC transport system substrate-binding protein
MKRNAGQAHAGLRCRVGADAARRSTRRKLLIALGAGALAFPLSSLAQQPKAKIPRVGILVLSRSARANALTDSLRAGLRELGYVEGRNISFEILSAEGSYERLPERAAELVRLNVDLIVGTGTPVTQAAKSATRTIPIVMIGVGDPVGTGLVASLARPGGNITGTSNLSPPLMVKRLELLKEAHPAVRRVAVLLNPVNPAQKLSFDAMQTAAAPLKVEIQKFEVRNLADIQSAFAAMPKQRIDGVAVAQDTVLLANAGAIAALAAKQRIASAGNIEYAEAGGLIGYDSTTDIYRYSATYVDKILKGAKPADLPVEQPSKFGVVVNMKTAKALGIKFPGSIMVLAERVIE